MSLSILNNVSSLQAQDALTQTSNSLATSLQRLSTGLKINSGADGPAALVISEEQKAQISGLQTAITNTNNAVSVVQTADGALNEVSSLLDTIRGLAVDSANTGVDDANALAANQAEISNALDTINNIAQNTQFGTTKLLNGSLAAAATVDAGSVGKETAAVSGTVGTGTYNFTVTQAATTAEVVAGGAYAAPTGSGENLTINGVQINISAADTTATLAAGTINQYTAQTGVTAVNNGGTLQLQSTSFGTGHQITVSSDTASGGTGFFNPASNVDGKNIQGTIDGGAVITGVGNVLTSNTGPTSGLSITFLPTAANSPTSNSNSGTITVDASKGLVFQIGANAGQTATFSINSVLAADLGVNGGTNLSTIDVTQPGTSSSILQTIDQSINQVATLRGQLGAFQSNTLQSTTNNLQAMLENTTSTESNIADTDFAAETANYTQASVLMQAGTSVLSNANQTTQLVLSLIQHLQ